MKLGNIKSLIDKLVEEHGKDIDCACLCEQIKGDGEPGVRKVYEIRGVSLIRVPDEYNSKFTSIDIYDPEL